jgi:hypothetical protein
MWQPRDYIGHTYGDSYDEIFEQFDRNSNINFLEIGIQKEVAIMEDYLLILTFTELI